MTYLKTILKLLLPAALLSACSQSEDSQVAVSEPLCNVNLSLDLSVASETDTRAGRPLESSDNWQGVTDVRIYVFRSESGKDGSFFLYHPDVRSHFTGETAKEEYLYVQAFEKHSVDGKAPVYKDEEHENHKYTLHPSLPVGYYRMLAVGYDDPESPLTINWKEGKTEWGQAVMTSDTPKVTEVFTGYPKDDEGNPRTFNIASAETTIHSSITLYRAVAGVLLYVKNIPTKYKSEYSWNSTGHGTGIITSDLDKDTELSVNEIAIVSVGYNTNLDALSRTWTDKEKGVFKFDASRFRFTRLVSIPLLDSYERETIGTTTYITESLYAGSFVMPSQLSTFEPFIAQYDGGQKVDEINKEEYHEFNESLYLCFFTITGTGEYYPLKLWPIKLVRSTVTDYDQEDNCDVDVNVSKDTKRYNLVANHLYCLGRRDITLKIDEPVDLKKEIEEHPHDELTITVIGSWQWDVNIQM